MEIHGRNKHDRIFHLNYLNYKYMNVEYLVIRTSSNLCALSLMLTHTGKETNRHWETHTPTSTHTTSHLPERQKSVRREMETYWFLCQLFHRKPWGSLCKGLLPQLGELTTFMLWARTHTHTYEIQKKKSCREMYHLREFHATFAVLALKTLLWYQAKWQATVENKYNVRYEIRCRRENQFKINKWKPRNWKMGRAWERLRLLFYP